MFCVNIIFTVLLFYCMQSVPLKALYGWISQNLSRICLQNIILIFFLYCIIWILSLLYAFIFANYIKWNNCHENTKTNNQSVFGGKYVFLLFFSLLGLLNSGRNVIWISFCKMHLSPLVYLVCFGIIFGCQMLTLKCIPARSIVFTECDFILNRGLCLPG